MKKKLLSLALVLVMALTLLPTAAFAADGDDPGSSGGDPVITEKQELPEDKNSEDKQELPENKESAGTNNPVLQMEQPTADAGDGGSGDNQPPASCIDATTEGQCKAETHHDICIEKCDKSENCPATGAHKTGCPKASNTGNQQNTGSGSGGQTTTPDPTTTLEEVPPKSATCTEPGTGVCYKDSSGNLFADSAGKTPISAAPSTPALGHLWSTSFEVEDIKVTQHIQKCTRENCDATRAEDHIYESGKCKVCGFSQPTSDPPSTGYLNITSAYVNRYSIDVTWTSDLADGTYFEIHVDGRYRDTVHPSKSSSGYFSATVDFSYYLDESYYIVDVYARDNSSIHGSFRVYNRYYDHDYDYWYDHYYPNSTPSTNSSGIPYASQVNGRYSAAEAIRILRNKNQNTLQNDLMSSSSTLDSFERLERAVKDANDVYVSVSVDRDDVPSALRAGGGIQISGAAFNASRTNSTVRLVVVAPSVNRYTGHGYQFSMTLTGVDSASSLDVPVVVSMPLPSDISASYVKVLHYHNSSVPTVITPKVSGGRISFPLTGFSDFVITDYGVPNYTYVSDGYGGYYVPVGNVPRRSLVDEHLAAVLPIIASTPVSGYVYDDVSGTYWAAGQIAWARDNGLMTGYYDGSFRPYAGTTRQELWMVLARLSGANPADMWAAREWAMNVGITDGSNPYAPLSNQQMIAMLYRYAAYRRMDLTAPSNLGYYRDGSAVSGYARTAMSWATNRGIIAGDANGRLNPQNIATRADFAVYLYRFLQ